MLEVPGRTLTGRVVRLAGALERLLVDEDLRRRVQRDDRQRVRGDLRRGLVLSRPLRRVEVDLALLDQRVDLLAAVALVVRATEVLVSVVALVDGVESGGIRATDPGVLAEVEVGVRQSVAEERVGIVDGDVELDADRLQLLLEDLAALDTRSPAGRVEAELGLLTTARPDLRVTGARRRRTAGAAVRIEQLDRALRVEVVLLEVRELAVRGPTELVERVVQRLQARGDSAVQRLDQRRPVHALRDRRADVLLRQERVPVTADVRLRVHLDVPVLLGEAGDGAVLQVLLVHEHRQGALGGRRDRVDLAAAHCLDLRVGVGDDPEVDRAEIRLLAVPLRVLLYHDALARDIVGHVERAVRDRVAVVTAHAVVPVLVELLALERETRVDVPEQVAVVGERLTLLPVEGHDLLAVDLGPRDVGVADVGSDVVRRSDELLPRVDVVRRGDRAGLVAEPVPVRALLDPDLESLLVRLDLGRHVKVIVAVVVDDV